MWCVLQICCAAASGKGWVACASMLTTTIKKKKKRRFACSLHTARPSPTTASAPTITQLLTAAPARRYPIHHSYSISKEQPKLQTQDVWRYVSDNLPTPALRIPSTCINKVLSAHSLTLTFRMCAHHHIGVAIVSW